MRRVVSLATIAGVLAVAATSHAQAPSPAPASPEPSPSPSPSPAPADVPGPPGSATMNYTISGFLGLGYSYGFAVGLGIGGRFQITLVPKGFIHSLHAPMHDELALEPGFDYFHAGYSDGVGDSWSYNEFTPLVGVLWNFWLNDNVAFYPKLDVGYRIETWSESHNGQNVGGGHNDLFPVYIQGAAGVVYRIGIVSLRGEVGWEDLRIGVGVTL
jgi:hypothetical protein